MPENEPALSSEEMQRRWQINYEAAIRAHERDYKNQDQLFQSVIQMAGHAITASSFTSGGSVLVSLAFVSSIFGSDPAFAIRLMPAVLAFALSAVMSAVAAGTAYLAQGRFAEASFHMEHSYEHPYVTEKPIAKAFMTVGNRWRWISIGAVIVAYCLLLAGIVLVWICMSHWQSPDPLQHFLGISLHGG